MCKKIYDLAFIYFDQFLNRSRLVFAHNSQLSGNSLITYFYVMHYTVQVLELKCNYKVCKGIKNGDGQDTVP